MGVSSTQGLCGEAKGNDVLDDNSSLPVSSTEAATQSSGGAAAQDADALYAEGMAHYRRREWKEARAEAHLIQARRYFRDGHFHAAAGSLVMLANEVGVPFEETGVVLKIVPSFGPPK